MNNIQIVEYHPHLAKGIAEMWNNSAEGWNGDAGNNTESSTRQKEEHSSHLNLYIALDGDVVVGYCKLSKYAYDENTLYIDLLNVLPSYHGQKIGKLLLLKALKRTIELGWPRLDLFTWSGNTKAVPLYKKAGFFWEKMESQSTHLMNFIPTVLNTELVAEYFQTADWYEDSTRKIEVCPDGKREKEFDFLSYSWEKDNRRLEIDFEKSGRGICRIENDDFSIKANIISNKLVFGQKYKVEYEIINKTTTAQKVKIKGINDKNIHFDFNFEEEIIGREVIVAEFYLDKVEKEQSFWLTHPCVKAEISINDKKAIFKTGINPKSPLFFSPVNEMINSNYDYELFINVENNYDQECTFQVLMPENEKIQYKDRHLEFTLKQKERSTISCPIKLKNAVILYEDLEIKVIFPNQECLDYKQKISLIMNTYNGNTYGLNADHYYLNSGKNLLSIDKNINMNNMYFMNVLSGLNASIRVPKLGKPFSSEFEHKVADAHEFYEEHGIQSLKLYYSSEDFKGCKFAVNYKLYPQGILEYYIEMLEFPEDKEEVDLSYSFYFSREEMQMFLNGKLIKTNDSLYNDSEMIYWDLEKLEENWLFNSQNSNSIAIIWDKEDEVKSGSWQYVIEKHFNKENTRQTKPLLIAVDYFTSVKDVRTFALNKKVEQEEAQGSIGIEINNNNPFVEGEFSLRYYDLKDKEIECSVEINSEGNAFEQQIKTARKGDNLHELEFKLEIKDNNPIQIIQETAFYNAKDFYLEQAVFLKKTGTVIKRKDIIESKACLSVSNGIIEMKSCVDFAPSLFSLQYKKHEWLDSSFPEMGAKSWWNPWIGGLMSMPASIKSMYLLEETSSADFIIKTDKRGNQWEGLEIITEYQKYNPLKGIKIKQYYLMMPGLPILAFYYEIEQNSGFYKNVQTLSEIFVKCGENIKEGSFAYEYAKQKVRTKCGFEDIGFSYNASLISYKARNREEILYLYNSDILSKMSVSSDLSVINGDFSYSKKLKNGEVSRKDPMFIIFSEKDLNEEQLNTLKKLRF